MATQREKIKNELDTFKKALVKYKKLFNADGIIDREEQAKLDEIQDAIDKIEKRLTSLKEKKSERGEGETGSIDGDIPDGDNFKGAKEIDVTAVKKITKLFEEGIVDEYGEGISHDDVKQNWVADCFFLSALAAVAKAKPSAIEKLVTEKKDGSYDVKLYQRGGFLWLDLKPEIVNVHPKTLEKNGQTTVGLADGELWVLLVERAFAQVNGGYDEIWFGNTEKALETITGKEASTEDVDDLNDKELVAFVNKALKDKRAITTATFIVDKGSKKAIAAGKVHLYMSHEYYVMSITSSTITLRNPHNNNTPGGKIVSLSLSDYRKYFEHLKSIDE